MKSILITGGAGFIGVNSAEYFAKKGWKVIVLDNLSRRGTQGNLDWLKDQVELQFEQADIRDGARMQSILDQYRPDVLLHLAAQVAVTTSVTDPREDFEINALGTLNILEAIRLKSQDTFFINASTNKVYGRMEDVKIVERNNRYEYETLISGVGEDQILDFHSPYGCSKGTADQYTIDYSRIYNLRATTFRQSCIYGTRQFGVEDQGWVAWFTIAAVLNKSITIFGDGKQIRDVLHVNDLVRAYECAINQQQSIVGKAINIGGGVKNTMSLLELLDFLEQSLGRKIPVQWDDWRPGDQPVFVCNLSKAEKLLGWKPEIEVEQGVMSLSTWVKDNRQLFDWLK